MKIWNFLQNFPDLKFLTIRFSQKHWFIHLTGSEKIRLIRRKHKSFFEIFQIWIISHIRRNFNLSTSPASEKIFVDRRKNGIFSEFLSFGVSSIFSTKSSRSHFCCVRKKLELFEKMRFFTEFPRSEVSKIIKNIRLSTLQVRRKYDFFGEKITVFFLFFRSKVSLIFAETLNYQSHGVSRKYELLAENIGLFSEFFSFAVTSISFKSSRSHSCCVRKKLELCDANIICDFS